MRFRPLLLITALAALVVGGLSIQTASAGRSDLSPMYWFEDTAPHSDPVVDGSWSMLDRNSRGVTALMHTHDLLPGHAYTMWWVVFNNPAACNGGPTGCSAADVGAVVASGGTENPAQAAVLRAAGGVAGPNGQLSLASRLKVGDLGGCQSSLPFALVCLPLTNPDGAAIMLVLHDHGPKLPGNEQLATFEGGCFNYIYGPTGAVNIEYDLGPYECFSPQASPHFP